MTSAAVDAVETRYAIMHPMHVGWPASAESLFIISSRGSIFRPIPGDRPHGSREMHGSFQSLSVKAFDSELLAPQRRHCLHRVRIHERPRLE